jgi:hypothetical protein
MHKSLVTLFMSGCLIAVTAAPSSIGVVKSNGDFRIDGATIRGNSTLFDGTLIETTSAASVVQLTGVQMTLSPDSRAKVYRDRIVLENGTGLVKDTETHVIQAASLRISSASKGSVLQVEVTGTDHVAVGARTGSAEVRNREGVLIARVDAGKALAFDPQTGAATAAKITGVLVSKDGTFFVTDVTTNITTEVHGTDLASFVGKKVDITGSTIPDATPAPGASQVVQVAGITKAVAAAVAGGGIGTAATVAIVGGVAVAGTALGLGAAGTFNNSPAVSR